MATDGLTKALNRVKYERWKALLVLKGNGWHWQAVGAIAGVETGIDALNAQWAVQFPIWAISGCLSSWEDT